jgi:NhaC family Na+:H+ antiporter
MSPIARKPELWQAFLPIAFLILALFVNVLVFQDQGLNGSNQMILILATAVASLIALRLGVKWKALREGMVQSISSAVPAILILLLIGSLSGTWLVSGIVPAMIYYGLQILHPSIFLVAACLICAVVSLASGSSWTTVATVGIALMGIGKALGMHEGWVAGAIISGAYFGDKISPLSDTTNLAPAVSGTDIFTHIRYLLITTVPSFLLTLFIFLLMGFWASQERQVVDVEAIAQVIDSKFYISVELFLVPAVLLFMILKGVAPIPALLIATLLGAVFAALFQPDVLKEIANVKLDFAHLNEHYASFSYVGLMKAISGSVSLSTGNPLVDSLLSSRGMAGMLNTIWLIICAMAFGGVMERSGLLSKITEAIISKVRSNTQLVTSTAATSIFLNLTASDQYLSIVVPGRMFAQGFQKRGLAPENLSRTLEDAGTVTSVLVPWNTCGATQAGVLHISTLAYAPYCFFNWISPIMTVLVAYLGIWIRKADD